MSYGKFVKDLPNVLRRQIIAYDNLPNHEGCVLFLRGGPKRVELDVRLFDHEQSDLPDLLEQLADRPIAPGTSLRVVIKDGHLAVIEPSSQAGQADRASKEAVDLA